MKIELNIKEIGKTVRNVLQEGKIEDKIRAAVHWAVNAQIGEVFRELIREEMRKPEHKARMAGIVRDLLRERADGVGMEDANEAIKRFLRI